MPAPGAFAHETWESGERGSSREWRYGFFFLNTETGRTEGYRDTRWATRGPGDPYYSATGPWLKWEGLLVNRRTGKSWRWPEDILTVVAMSDEHVFVVERDEEASEARFSLLDSDMRLVAEFLQSTETPHEPHASFSPDGRTIALVVDLAVAYMVDVGTVSPRVLLEGAEREGWEQGAIRIQRAYRGPGLLLKRIYWRNTSTDPDSWAGEYSDENRYFAWSGSPLPGREEAFFTTCRGRLSPDGRYLVREEGAAVGIAYVEDWVPTADPWPSVVISDARTCEPLLRVRSAVVGPRWFPGGSGGSWLSDSSGFVLDVDDGGMMVRIADEPELVALPSWGGRLVAAPTGGGRYFANFSGVWDSQEDTWITPPLPGGALEFSWGDDHTEVLYANLGYWGEGAAYYLLLRPQIEFPPFDREIAFRVAGSGEICAELRDEPQNNASVIGCASGGTRLTLAVPEDAPQEECGLTCYPSARNTQDGWSAYVRTEDGLEGWIPLDSLEHD